MQQSRRALLRNLSSAMVVGVASSGTAVATDESETQDDNIIYKGKKGRIVQTGPHSYLLVGAESEKDFEFLIDKRDELLASDSSGVSTSSHSLSDADSKSGYYQGTQYGVHSNLEAEADNGLLEVGGNCEGNWWARPWDDDYIKAQLTLTFKVTASYNGNSLSVSFPSSGGWSSGNSKSTATLTNTYDVEQHFPGAYIDRGTLSWEADCFNWVSQDNRVKFDFQNGDVQYAGTYIKLLVGHCVT